MRKRRLPPLNPLRTFEAAARHGSFTKAAEELSVTPVAVSRQVAVLESYFGTPLFYRLSNTVRLTSAGQDLLPAVTTALDLLDESARRLRRLATDPLVICTYQPLAMSWLIPRLPRFYAEHPHIDLNLTTAVRPHEFDYARVDVGIHHGYEPQPELYSKVILPDLVVPVCAPQLCEGEHPLPPVENLRHHTLLHSRFRRLDWEDWMRVVGGVDLAPRNELTFNSTALAVQAAAEGLGVAIAQRLQVSPELASGRLVIPFQTALQRPRGISVVAHRERLADPRVVAFRDWVEEEARLTLESLNMADRPLQLEQPEPLELA